ncbi:MAG: EF-hand domain-containing protein [Acidobacteria bacterium]|nr:EF-hand domain-containing protein [Acidobacteriota bacterium]
MLNSVGSLTSTYHASSHARMSEKVVDRMFKKVDTNQDGQITKDELAQALASGNPKTDRSGKKLSVDDFFQALDTAGKGYITKEDAAAGLDAMAQKLAESKSNRSGEAHHGRGGGGGHASGGGTATGGTGSTTDTTSYDPRDTNQDGTVSEQEAAAYAATHYVQTDQAAASTQETTTATYA